MKKNTKRRNRLAKDMLAEEMSLFDLYCVDGGDSPEVQQHRAKIVRSVKQTLDYFKNSPEKRLFVEEVLIKNNGDVIAMCDKFKIGPATYYNWRNHILRVFGRFAEWAI